MFVLYQGYQTLRQMGIANKHVYLLYCLGAIAGSAFMYYERMKREQPKFV